jgi:hypothetical protein
VGAVGHSFRLAVHNHIHKCVVISTYLTPSMLVLSIQMATGTEVAAIWEF